MVDGEIVDEELLGGDVMVARVTLAEVDAVRMSMDAARRAVPHVRPARRCTRSDGYEGCYVLTTPEGKALVITFWATRRPPRPGLASGHYARAGREVRHALPLAAGARDLRRRDRRGAARRAAPRRS